MRIIITIILTYLIGCFSSSYFLGKFIKNIDIRNYGSGNAGATNALRVLGKKIGTLTFLLDFLKGILALLIGGLLLGFNGRLIGAIFVVIGHNYPVFLGFKGGKGIATSLGVLTILDWKLGFICLLIGIIIIIFTRYVSLGSIIASISAPIIVVFLMDNVDKNLYFTILLLAIMSVYRHKSNILRLCRGEENKLGNKI